MGKITEIKNGKRDAKRVNIFVDGRFMLALDTEIAFKEKIWVDTELNPDRISELERSDRIKQGMDTAVRFLGYRPRSETEIKERLQRHGFEGDIVEIVISKLKEQGLVDDRAFARFWTENRESFSPHSQYFTRRELKQKGVAEEIIDETVSIIDDSESAYRTALTGARRINTAEYGDFRNRLGGYLRRRGFSYETINKTIERIWQEKKKEVLP
jgi:regulatory protein